jgi:replicative DNA helicase
MRKLHDDRIEEAWLATLLRNPECISTEMAAADNADLLYKDEHAAVWRAMMAMNRRALAIDPVSLSSYLKTGGYLTERDAESVVHRLVPRGSSPGHLSSWTRQLQELYHYRSIYGLGGDLQTMAGDPDTQIDHILREISDRVMSAYGTVAPDEISRIAGTMLDELRLSYGAGTYRKGLCVGIYELDNITDGFEDDDYVGICSRPGNGKTSLTLQLVRNLLMSQTSGVVLFFSLEMSSKRVAWRLVSMLSGVPYRRVKSGGLTPEEFVKVESAYAIMSGWGDRLVIYTPANFPGGVTTERIAQVIRAKSMRYRVIASVVDNFNLLPARNLDERNSNSRQLKSTTLETRSPIFTVVQLRRDTNKDNRPPIVSDIKDTGQLEQDFDRIILIDREDRRNAHVEDRWAEMGIIPHLATFDIAKNRDGEEGKFFLQFHGPTMEFVPYTDDTRFGSVSFGGDGASDAESEAEGSTLLL